MSVAPPVPADLDLTALSYIPLQVGKLLSSDTWLLATGDEAKAAVTLWCRAWHQVPAGSLPNDDRLLAALSGAGTKWAKIKAVALRGFIECSDGRLYHSHLCEEAVEARTKRLQWKEKKRRQRGGQDSGQSEIVPRDNVVTNCDVPKLSLDCPQIVPRLSPNCPSIVPPLRDGTGRDGKKKVPPHPPSGGQET